MQKYHNILWYTNKKVTVMASVVPLHGARPTLFTL